MKIFGKEFKFNGYDVYHKGNLKTLNPTENNLTNQLLDNVKTTGFYYAGGGNAVTGKPSGVDAFGLLVVRSAAGYYIQICFGANLLKKKIFIRQAEVNTWSAWSSVYTSDYKPTASDVGAYSKKEIDDKITSSNGTKVTVSAEPPATHLTGQVWIDI